MSNIRYARERLQHALDTLPMSDKVRREILLALANMTREIAVRHATAKPVRIDQTMRRKVRQLARTTDMTITDIANAVGLRNNGRVSEILHHKR